MSVTEEFPQLAFTARNGQGAFADEVRRALNELRTLQRATRTISSPPVSPHKEWNDEYHADLVKLFALIREACRPQSTRLSTDEIVAA